MRYPVLGCDASKRCVSMSHVTKSYRAGSIGVNGCSRPGRDSQPFGVGLLIGAVISAGLWAAIGAVMFFPSGSTKIASLLVALM